MGKSADIDKLIARAKNQQVVQPTQELEQMKDLVAQLQTRCNELMLALDHKRKKNAAVGMVMLEAAIEKHQCEPADQLLEMVMQRGPNGGFVLDPGLRIKILTEVLAYRTPKVKTQEIHHDHEHNIQVTVQNFGTPLSEPIDITPRIERGN